MLHIAPSSLDINIDTECASECEKREIILLKCFFFQINKKYVKSNEKSRNSIKI